MNSLAPAVVIFDCDGVLVDSEPITGSVLAQMAQEQGLQWSRDEIARNFLGRAMKECIRIIEETLGRKVPEHFTDEYRTRRNQALREQLQPTPGMREMLESLPMPFCVASNGEASKMDVTLEAAGILDLFEGRIFSVSDVEHPKPAPDLYLHAARVMNVPSARAIVVEDSLLGIEAGVRAGMRVIAHTSAHPAARLLAAGATAIVEDMRALPQVIASLDKAQASA